MVKLLYRNKSFAGHVLNTIKTNRLYIISRIFIIIYTRTENFSLLLLLLFFAVDAETSIA